MLTLKNERCTVQIDSQRGARVTSFLSDSMDVDVVWSGHHDGSSKEWWHGGVPILFPFAGRVWHKGSLGQYQVCDQIFQMPIHGLVHQAPWKVVSKTDHDVELDYASTCEDLEAYPWDFSLRMRWSLFDTTLSYTLSIKNKGCVLKEVLEKPMPFAAGLHPYFQVKDDQAPLLISPKKQYAVSAEGDVGEISFWKPDEALLQKPSLILEGVVAAQYTIPINKDSYRLQCQVSSPEDTVVLWSDRRQDYMCVEPWMGFPNALQYPEKTKQLAKGEIFEWTGSMMIMTG